VTPATPQIRHIDVGDVRLRTSVRGTGRPLLLVTGLGASLDLAAPFEEELCARGRQVISFDAPGVGGSTAYRWPRRLSGVAETVVGLLDRLGVDQVDVLGVSLGGAVALQAAAIDARIRCVVAVSTFSDLRTVATERAPRIASPEEIEAAFRLAEATAHFKVDDVSPVVSARQIGVPVLLVHGEADRETPPAHSQRVFAALPGPKRLLLVPGAGHNDALRADVWRAIEAWIDEACPPGR
jgi:pimeloyl-ACP methyl ester carboxylesterase